MHEGPKGLRGPTSDLRGSLQGRKKTFFSVLREPSFSSASCFSTSSWLTKGALRATCKVATPLIIREILVGKLLKPLIDDAWYYWFILSQWYALRHFPLTCLRNSRRRIVDH